MSLSKMSAGSGYEYLLRHIARADSDAAVDRSGSLTAYYAASGYPAGVWLGRGLAGLGDGQGLAAGSVVSEEQMARLFGAGHDPLTDQPLGRSYRAEAGRGASVAGFDLTFSPAKSVSVLWALADEPTRGAILAAHHAAVAQTVGVIERDVARTRTGHAGAAVLATRGLIAAAFDHYDSRAGDPQLHTHVTVANRVQGLDGAWRTLYGAELYRAAVAMSATYDALLADHLTRRLGLAWEQRPRGRDRNPAHELTVIPDALIAEFSRRAAAITASKDEVIARFVTDHGRAPTRAEAATIRQHATLDTRQAKHTRPLTDYTPEWAARAAAVLGADPQEWVRSVLRAPHTARPAHTTPAAHRTDEPTRAADATPRPRDLRRAGRPRVDTEPALFDIATALKAARRATPTGRKAPLPAPEVPAPQVSAGQITDQQTATIAAKVVAVTEERRSTWSRWNLTAEVMRQIREQGWHFTTPRDLLTVRDRILTTAIGDSVLLNPPDIAAVPDRWLDPSTARSAFARPERFTSHAVLHAEDRLLAAANDLSAPTAPQTTTHCGPDPDSAGSEQAAAVDAICTSRRSLDLLIGPAGTGKTATIQQLTQRWQAEHGAGSVITLAVSAAAAHVLATATGRPADTAAMWLTWHAREDQTLNRLAELQYRRDDMDDDIEDTTAIDARITHLSRTYRQWRIRPGTLIVLDEASMADVHTLDRITTAATQAGAKVLLVGDDHQLAAVGPGGTFGMLTHHHPNVAYLSNIRRFRDPDGTPRTWEAAASAQLRLGNPDALAAYQRHDRIRGGDRATTLQNAYHAWTLDLSAGKDSLLLAVDNATVTELNTRAHADRIAAGDVQPGGVTLADGTTAGVGDWIITRRNDRTLHTSTRAGRDDQDGGFVRNGQHLVITAVRDDAAITARTRHGDAMVDLPADYTARHVQLGYAATIHRAQGATVDTAHVILGPGATREALYVGLTRGTTSNTAYGITEPAQPANGLDRISPPSDPETPLHALGRVLATVGAETSAHGSLRELQTTATSRRQFLTEYRQIAERTQQQRVLDILDRLGPRYAPSRTSAGDLDGNGRYQLLRLVGAIRDGDRYRLDPARALPELARQSANLDELVGRYETLADTTHHQHRGQALTRIVDGHTPTATIGITDPTTLRALLDREELLDRLPPDRHQPARPAASPTHESHYRPAPAPEHHIGIGR